LKKKYHSNPVLISDLPTTILDLLKIDFRSIKGKNIFLEDREFIISEGFKPNTLRFSETNGIKKITYSCIWNNWQLILNEHENIRHLFDINSDPSCTHDLKNKHKKLTAELDTIIQKHIEKTGQLINIKKKTNEKIKKIRYKSEILMVLLEC
jgi:hypothetical protein